MTGRNNRYDLISQGALLSLITVFLLIAAVGPLYAQEEEIRNWTLDLGATIVTKPIYSGSNELAAVPYPFINAEYRTTYASLFAFGDEAGIKLHLPQYEYSFLAFGVKAGQTRDNENEAVESLLAGTPSIENPLQFFSGLTLRTRFGEISSKVQFMPIDAEYDQAGLKDEEYTGVKVSFDYLVGGNVDPKMFVFAGIGAAWANDDYAEAYHGLRVPGVKLEAFAAEGGMNDFHGMFGAIYTFGEHVTGILKLSGAKLLGDAADSPLTKSEFQPDITAVVSYAF